jgi:L-glutamine-phosphate cytidylyltransferase
MKAIFMAAGVGSRLSSKTNRPKSTLEIGDDTIIGHTVQMMQNHGIESNFIVGFEKEVIKETLAAFSPLTYFENPFYRVTNSIGSLWIARAALVDAAKAGEDLILANADVYWDEDILSALLSYDSPVVMLGDRTRCADGDYFFHLEDGKITSYGKGLALEERSCEYVGIAKVRADFLPVFIENLDHLIWQENYDMWWEDVLYRSCETHPVDVVDVEGAFWAEVDYLDDYRRILTHLGLDVQAALAKVG